MAHARRRAKGSRPPETQKTLWLEKPCKDCGTRVWLKHYWGRAHCTIPAFCTACLMARVREIQQARQESPRRLAPIQHEKIA